jgi:BRCT domain type II-containing protein
MICPENCCIGITGTLKTMTLENAIRLIHEASCAYTDTIGADTTCLMVGDNPDPQNMLDAALFDIHIVWEDEFADKITKQRCGEDM